MPLLAEDVEMFGQSPVCTIIKLLVLSLVVGFVLRMLNITPLSLIENFGENIQRMFGWLRGFAGWALDYVLLGAVIVVPIWLIMMIVNRARR
jgi:hypothetical protein